MDQIHHRFGLDQVESTVKKGTARELSWRRRLRPGIERRLQYAGGDGGPAMSVELDDILAGVTTGRVEAQHECIIDKVCIRRCGQPGMEKCVRRTQRWGLA